VYLEGLPISAIESKDVVEIVASRLRSGHGGWIVTANIDFLQRAAADTTFRQLYSEADLIVADGMPLLWAASLQGTPIPERISGSDLIWSLAEHAAKAGHSLYLLGGSNNAACRASSVLVSRWPQIKIAGWSSPQISSPVTASELSAIRTELCRWRPDLILVAFGSPKQEYLIRALRTDFPAAWMIGCGYGLSFIAGDSSRAPKWMQRAGLEWFPSHAARTASPLFTLCAS
jgi:N-acetylglucosaminyldiphosphoundecaprenol N-acetyl-beta-D-mannosaminyltransferase